MNKINRTAINTF